MFELFANIFLLVFLVYAYFTHVLEAAVSKSYMKNPSNLMPDVWPKVIIALLVICLVVNIIKIFRKNKGNPKFTFKAFYQGSLAFFKSKTFLGILILVIASLILEPLGFIVTSFFILFCYGLLLGEKKIWRLLLISLGVSFLLHIIFSGLLDVTLPRGTVGFLRSFALMLENLF